MKKLKSLYDNYQAVVNKYSDADWSWGDVPASDKRTATLRYNKFFNACIAAGFDMLSTMPDFLKPNADGVTVMNCNN